jgi:hypothetical protein
MSTTKIEHAYAEPFGFNRWMLVGGLALLTVFTGWLAWFTSTLPHSSSLGWWILAFAGSLVGCLLAILREALARWGLLIALVANVAMRSYFAFAGDWTRYNGFAEVLLALGLLAALAALVRHKWWLRWALLACGAAGGLLLLRNLVDGAIEPGFRQAIHLTAFILLGLAAPRRGA